jgi:hypothetical protein
MKVNITGRILEKIFKPDKSKKVEQLTNQKLYLSVPFFSACYKKDKYEYLVRANMVSHPLPHTEHFIEEAA